MAELRVYTTPTCPYCRQAKDWLRDHGCAFEEIDITRNVEWLREWRALTGGAGVPTIAHGKDFMVGFNPERLAQFVDCCAHCSAVEA